MWAVRRQASVLAAAGVGGAVGWVVDGKRREPARAFLIPTSLMPRATKKRVGKYDLEETLGEGNFATVKRARDTETGAAVRARGVSRERARAARRRAASFL